MKITLLYSTPADLELGMDRLIRIAMNVLIELGLTVKEIDLHAGKLPYYEGKSNNQVNGIVKDIRESSGVIFASAARLPFTPAAFSVFLEYLTLPEYSDVLQHKNCLLMLASENGGERSALESLSRAVQNLGAYDSVKVGLQRGDINKIDSSEEFRDIFERLMEDYYRIVRQNRQYFIPLDSPRDLTVYAMDNQAEHTDEHTPDYETKQKLSINDLAKKLNFNILDENQAEDINEISDYFNKIISEHHHTDTQSPVFVKSLTRDITGISQNPSSCKQLTQSLHHYFQPQLSHNLNAVIQLQIVGDEAFNGFITIKNAECLYSDGSSLNPDITIITDASVWRDVCTGKYSAQKAFMIGRLKVRGNFVLLTKFDHLFRLGK